MDGATVEKLARRERIEAYALDRPGDAVPFSARLRAERRWSADYAARAVREYKRFLVLAVSAGHPVTPSLAIDHVWHLHLTDTRRYWDEFCPEVLGRPLHHEPSRGGAEEACRHQAQYRATLDAYERVFGEAPPRDLWPSGPSLADRARRLIGRLRRARAAAPALLLAGCAAVYNSSSPGAVQGPLFLAGYVVLAVVALALMTVLQGRALSPRTPSRLGPADLDAYDLAYLAGGGGRVLQTALLRLVQSGHLLLSDRGRRLVRGAPLPEDAPLLERNLVAAIRKGRLKHAPGAGTLVAQRRKLQDAGLLPDARAASRAWRVAALVILPVLLLGAVRWYFGVAGHRPVAFLIIAMLALGLIAAALTAAGVESPTRQGRRLRDAARAAHPRPTKADASPGPETLALYGVAVLVGTDLAGLQRHLGALGGGGGTGDGGSGGCGSGGGCGGGGCGG